MDGGTTESKYGRLQTYKALKNSQIHDTLLITNASPRRTKESSVSSADTQKESVLTMTDTHKHNFSRPKNENSWLGQSKVGYDRHKFTHNEKRCGSRYSLSTARTTSLAHALTIDDTMPLTCALLIAVPVSLPFRTHPGAPQRPFRPYRPNAPQTYRLR